MRTLLLLTLVGLLSLPSSFVASAQEASEAPAPEKLVNLNTANTEELQTLPGVGPTLAMRIVEYREGTGRFVRIEDVMNVRGVGEASFLRMRHLLTVTPPESRATTDR